jgi:hypothetical protein
MTSRGLNRLTATRASNLKEHGRHADGGGLYLFIDATRRRWLFRYTWRGKAKEIGLGSARALSLAKAREKAAEYREMVAEGLNPKTMKQRCDRNVTFGEYGKSAVFYDIFQIVAQRRTRIDIHEPASCILPP